MQKVVIQKLEIPFQNKEIQSYLFVQQWLKTNKNLEFLYFIFDKNITDFYSWIIPKNEFVIIGTGLKRNNNLKEKLELLKIKVKESLSLNGELVKTHSHRTFIPKSKTEIVLGKRNVLLIGESSGMVSPSSGEGISFALRGGINCAKALNSNFENAFEKYSELCKSLIKEIESKIEKAKLLFNIDKRRKYLNELTIK